MPIQEVTQTAHQIFDYLIDWEQQTRKPFFRITDHQDLVIEEAELVGLPGIEFDVAGSEADTWLVLERLRPESPPQPPELIAEFLALKNNPDADPGVYEAIEVHRDDLPETLAGVAAAASVMPEPDVDGLVRLALEDLPAVASEINRWVADEWRRWTERERPRRRTIKLYEALFRLQKRIEEEGTESPTELVWGLGRCTWNHSSAHIDYPLLTRRVEIEIDERLNIVVRPTQHEPVIETERLERLGIDSAATVRDFARQLIADDDAIEMAPCNRESYADIARQAASHLHERGEYFPYERVDEGDRRNPAARDYPRLNDTWVLFARRRGTHIFAEDVRRLKESLEESERTPSILEAIVKGPPAEQKGFERINYRGFAGIASGGGSLAFGREHIPSEARELYFPKPYNTEQVQIVERLDQSDGVVVQGPPGTGKSHTIANIICHYLATGRRVLVTSKGESALEVLRDHLPPPLRSLAISLLTSEREGLRQLERSVGSIAGQLAILNERELERDIRDNRHRVDTYHEKIAGIDGELEEIAGTHLSNLEVRGKQYRPEDLACWVVEARSRHGWLEDRPKGIIGNMPFREADLDELRAIRDRAGDRWIHLSVATPALAELPTEQSIVETHRHLRSRVALLEAAAVGEVLEFDSHALRKAKELEDGLKEYREHLDLLRSDWERRLRVDFAEEGEAGQHIDAIEQWLSEVELLEERRKPLIGRAIELENGALSELKFHKALARGAAGKKPVGLFDAGAIKEAIAAVRLDGEPPRDAEQWTLVRDTAALRRDARQALVRWNALAEEIGAPAEDTPPQHAPRRIAEIADACRRACRLGREFDRRLPGWVRALFGPGKETLLADDAGLDRLHRSLDAGIQRADHDIALRRLREFRKRLTAYSDPISERAREIIQRLGDEDFRRDALESAWHALREDLRRIESLEADFERAGEIIKSIREAGAPRWADRLEHGVPGAEGDTSLLPSDASEAWVWAQSAAYIEAIDQRDRLQMLSAARSEAERYLAQAHQHTVELSTWLAIKRNTTSSISAALQAYLKAIKSIGSGTGKRAVRYRREAQRALKTAHQAVPCWIMPHHRVSESLPPEFGSFDLVIIDEASQSDAWALPSLLRGKKILIVGDDKQVSPGAVAVPEETIRRMQGKHLASAVYGSFLLPDRSIYDLASTLFAENIIRLREHFRCVEPIIQFSSREFYGNEIKPLRIPKPSERIDPPLVDVFVEDGSRDARRQTNEAEAEAIVDEIARLVDDVRYAGRSIGVVTLLGHQQANLLRERIYQRIGSEAWQAHNLHVGEPSNFQGREADIVMLSMVVCPAQLKAATLPSDEQRFNVAASRARDRLYVFHSVPRERLSKRDLRARLLDHLQVPIEHGPRPDVSELRDLCQSGFEAAVFDALVKRGYRVTPQVRAGGYSIDLVVEGDNDALLAIELDGDQYHIDRWIEDMHRQRVLERMGWRFWRCWGSSYTLDSESCLADLEGRLAAIGILPNGGIGGAPSRYTEYRRVRGLSGEDAAGMAWPLETEKRKSKATNAAEDVGVETSMVTALVGATTKSGEMAPRTLQGGEVPTRPGCAQGVLFPDPYDQAIPGSFEEATIVRGDDAGELAATESVPTEELPPPGQVSARVVEINDVVVYETVDKRRQQGRAQIVSGNSKPDYGILNRETPYGVALLGASVGEIVTAMMPGNRRVQLQILGIERPE